eukprot:374812_1
MRTWIIKSGLVNRNITNQCKIVNGTDCAALAVHNYVTNDIDVFFEKDKKKKKSKLTLNIDDNKDEYKGNEIKQQESDFQIGDEYILIDAGGGTVDVACHQVLGRFQVKEIFHPSGGKWGSCYIDDQYI